MRHRSLYSEGCSPSVDKKKKGEIQPDSESPDQAGFGWAALLFLSQHCHWGHTGNLLQPGDLTSEDVSHL